ncbi:protein phosphatase 2c-like protein, putative [Plasmodium reichenowi]|uniref:Protein phosphatase 2c-like protein, putative n=1 Tax=Plasmodium reichenowi TaxID=5854 RepID=A0A151L6G1_PLARE|nr:protein phosphatase 2c-like protein, putative [Plasmodium reichenowi]KYN94533.1 protein phosphatase 2c-like protein, putative [Plasmodium reichenowi]
MGNCASVINHSKFKIKKKEKKNSIDDTHSQKNKYRDAINKYAQENNSRGECENYCDEYYSRRSNNTNIKLNRGMKYSHNNNGLKKNDHSNCNNSNISSDENENNMNDGISINNIKQNNLDNVNNVDYDNLYIKEKKEESAFDKWKKKKKKKNSDQFSELAKNNTNDHVNYKNEKREYDNNNNISSNNNICNNNTSNNNNCNNSSIIYDNNVFSDNYKYYNNNCDLCNGQEKCVHMLKGLNCTHDEDDKTRKCTDENIKKKLLIKNDEDSVEYSVDDMNDEYENNNNIINNGSYIINNGSHIINNGSHIINNGSHIINNGSHIINNNIMLKKNKHENLLSIKYSNMILNDIRDVDIIVVFLFSLFLYFNANNIVDMLDRNKKERYFLINSLNINHDVIKFPTFPKEIVESFLKNDFSLLKKYIKNKCNKLKKKYKNVYLKKYPENNKEEKNSKKKNFKYELKKKKKEKCSFSTIVESVERDELIYRDITEIDCDKDLPDLKINFIVMGAYCFYQKDMKPFQDKNTFFYKSPSYICDSEISVACKKGKKVDFPNQDDFTIIQTNDWILIMVFDGHGPSGHDISNFVHVVLPLLFSYNIEKIYENPVRTMKTLFYMINCYLVNYSYCINNNINPININFIDYNLSGTTCTIILYNFITKKIYSAHTGDSRAVMGKQNPQTNKFSAYNITEDHKPSLKLEKDRILAFGGEVKKLHGDVAYRVFVKDEMYPGLAMSRAIGDITSSFIGVTCEPTIKILDKLEEDKFIIVATDGIWEFISSEECVQMVSKKKKKKVHIAMDDLGNFIFLT